MQATEGETTWRGICSALREQLHRERTQNTGLQQNTGAMQIELSFKKQEMAAMREKMKSLEARVAEADIKVRDADSKVKEFEGKAKESDGKVKELEWECDVLRHEVEELKTSMETRVKDLVKDLKAEVTAGKDFVEGLKVRACDGAVWHAP
jgi:chromosome segregation ATPase